jgi:glutamine synthetase
MPGTVRQPCFLLVNDCCASVTLSAAAGAGPVPQGDENMFLPQGDDPRKPSKVGLHAIGGVLDHLRALTAITASTVNSYRRFADAGFWAPVFADWGFQNRTTALRVSAPGRFEYRCGGAAVNPYLSFAALLAAMKDGLDRSLDPGPPEERNIYEAMSAGKQVPRIPQTLGERSKRSRWTR